MTPNADAVTGGHPHHQKLHAEITDRLCTLTAPPVPVPAWTAPDRRRHALQQTAWAMFDHLRCCHGVRRLGKNPPPISRLVDLHAHLHMAAR